RDRPGRDRSSAPLGARDPHQARSCPVKTGCILTYKGPGAIRISIGAPRFSKALPAYRALMPRREWLGLDKATYCRRYFGVLLAQLDPQKVWDELHELAGPGVEP